MHRKSIYNPVDLKAIWSKRIWSKGTIRSKKKVRPNSNSFGKIVAFNLKFGFYVLRQKFHLKMFIFENNISDPILHITDKFPNFVQKLYWKYRILLVSQIGLMSKYDKWHIIGQILCSTLRICQKNVQICKKFANQKNVQ